MPPQQAAETDRIRITFERGLNEYLESSMLPEGAVPTLVNWESSPTGELRARAPWSKGSTSSAPGTRKGSGIGYFSRVIVPGILQQSTPATSIGAGTVDVVWPDSTTSGNLLILLVGAIQDGAGSSAITTPAGWTQAEKNEGGTIGVAIYYKANAASESGTVTVTATGGAGGSITAQLLEVTGIKATSPEDVSTSNSGTSVTPSSGTTGTTSQAIEFVVAILGDPRLESQTSPTNNFIQLSENSADSTTDGTFGFYYKTTNATGTQSCSATTATSDSWLGCISAFKGWYASTPAAGQTNQTEFLVAQNDTTQYDIFTLDRTNLSAGTWTNVNSVNVSDPSELVAFAPGFGRTFFVNRQFGQTYYYDGIGINTITGSPTGRCIATHKNMLWVAGSDASPGRLHFSNPVVAGVPTFNTSENFIDVAAEDGEPIEDIVPQEDFLVIGKRTGLWILTGSGLDTFALRKLAIGGLAPGRTLMPTPYGTIAAGRATIWVINGTTVTRISLPISRSYLYSSAYFTSSFVDDTYYLCDSSDGTVFALNMQTGTWRIEEVGSAATEGPAQVYNHDFTQVFAPKAGTVGGLLNYRNFPALSRGKDFDTLTQDFHVETGMLFPVGPEEALTPRHLFLRMRQHGGVESQEPIDLTPHYRTLDGEYISGDVWKIYPKNGASVFRERVDLGNVSGISGVTFEWEQTLGTTHDDTFDIEEATFEYIIEKRR